MTLDGQEWPKAYVALKDEFKGKIMEEDIHKQKGDKVTKHKQLVGGAVYR
jgi:hypothetical protein